MNAAGRTTPTFLNLMGALTLVTIGVTLAMNFAVVLLMPVPAAPRMNLGAAAAALRDPSGSDLERGQLALKRDCAAPSKPSVPNLAQIAAAVLGVAPAQVHLQWTNDAEPTVDLRVVSDGTVSETESTAALREVLTRPSFELPAFELALRQADGCWRVVGPSRTPTESWRLRILLAFALSAAVLAPLAWWLALRLSRPLRHLAREAERLSLGVPTAPNPAIDRSASAGLPIHEVLVAREAMYDLHDRLRRQADDSIRMLAAVAHDLRTPLTALRLRVDTAPPEQAARMTADLERMEAMITQVLDYARGQSHVEPFAETDLAELVEECIDDAQALGKHVEASRIDSLNAVVESLGLRRALINLIENAVRYAEGARVGVWREDGWFVLQVDDDGPGIPPDQSERLQQPFQRLETSRSLDTGGIGLGLAVVHAVALRHGGNLILRNRDEGGLSARIQWPVGGYG